MEEELREMRHNLETLLAPLRDMEEFTQLKTALEQGESPLEVVGGMDAQKAHMIYGLRQAKGVNLIVTYNEIRAKELLEYGELSLNEIADKLNYSSAAYLSSQFKSATGLTPSYFKKIKANKRKPLDEV